MPELPEVEAARRGLREQFIGKTLIGHELRLPKLIAAPSGLSLDSVHGKALTDVRRHGKYLPLIFDDLAAVVHLKLSGQLVGNGSDIAGFHAGHPVPYWGAELPHKSTHLVLCFDEQARIFLTDIRQFARIVLIPVADLADTMAGLHLGPDAIGPNFTREWLHERLPRRSGSRMKPLLLDQTFMAGLGNIYVDESLFAARLHPERLAGSLTSDEVDRLFDAIVDVLNIAVPIGGAAVLNSKAQPEHGEFPFVHGRKGEPCIACGAPIVKERVNNRGTYRCPHCQPDPATDRTSVNPETEGIA
jgi:formamidopyrimidine-DNA glycosylase